MTRNHQLLPVGEQDLLVESVPPDSAEVSRTGISEMSVRSTKGRFIASSASVSSSAVVNRGAAAALAHQFGDTALATDPDGGVFLWVTLAEPRVDPQALCAKALAGGVAYIPGPAFSTNDKVPDTLCFATYTPDSIDEGVAQLKRAIDRTGAQQ